MQGLGNDYIYVDGFRTPLDITEAQRWSIGFSDRHFGIGADGLVLILPSEAHQCEMRIFNADGSEAQMCGNAIRCVAKYLRDHCGVTEDSFTVDTLAGSRRVQIIRNEGSCTWVRVNMGVPILESDKIPVSGPSRRVIRESLDLNGESLNVTCVSMGNPHCITFLDHLDDDLVHHLGPAIERAPIFPQRINAEFVQILDRTHIKMRVWERGSGETLACGTGASAAVVASILNGFCDANVRVSLLGGDLEIEWDGQSEVYMTGPAMEVFQGWIERPTFLK